MTRKHGYSIEILADGELYTFTAPASTMLVCNENRCPVCGADAAGIIEMAVVGLTSSATPRGTRYKCGSVFSLSKVKRGFTVLMYHTTQGCELSKGACEDTI